MDRPQLAQNGAHVIPIYRIKCADCECYAQATGTVRWHPEEGVTFDVAFPNLPGPLLASYYRRQHERGGAGRIIERSTQPGWIAQTSDGLQLELYATQETPESEIHYGTSGSGTSSRVTGRAMFASVRLASNNLLSFWNATPEQTRMFFLGFGSYSWTKTEDTRFYHENGETSTRRCSVLLRPQPEVQLYAAGPHVNLPDGGWLAYDDGQENADIISYPRGLERSFISFLNGCRTRFFWRDSLIDCSTLQRVYFGWERVRLDDLKLTHTQPLPLRDSIEAMKFGKEVVEQLPALFTSYLEVNRSLDIAFVMNPLWSSFDTVLDDRLAFACVSLERLATAWEKARDDAAAADEKEKGRFWERRQSCMVRKALKAALKSVASEAQLREEQINVIEHRIDQLGQRPNVDRLTAIFGELGLTLGDYEQEVIAERNVALHGRPTLRDSSSTPAIDDEALRFDTLRMVITKAVLALLQYRGPYVNYAARPRQGNFPIERL